MGDWVGDGWMDGRMDGWTDGRWYEEKVVSYICLSRISIGIRAFLFRNNFPDDRGVPWSLYIITPFSLDRRRTK